MKLETTLTEQEYASLLAAMRRSGFNDVRAFIYWATMARATEILSEKDI